VRLNGDQGVLLAAVFKTCVFLVSAAHAFEALQPLPLQHMNRLRADVRRADEAPAASSTPSGDKEVALH
jgi:hypothetical protein